MSIALSTDPETRRYYVQSPPRPTGANLPVYRNYHIKGNSRFPQINAWFEALKQRPTAHIRQPEQESLVRDAGAHTVVIGQDLPAESEFAPYDLVLESVGGKTLTAALGAIAPDGVVVLFGTTGGGEVTFNAQRFYGVSNGAKLFSFMLFHELKHEAAVVGLQRLVNLIADGLLKPQISVEAPWTEIADIAQQLTDRKYPGKAVLHFD